jgi:hypothetical protein
LAVRPIGGQLSTRHAAAFGVSLVCVRAGWSSSVIAPMSARIGLFMLTLNRIERSKSITPGDETLAACAPQEK